MVPQNRQSRKSKKRESGGANKPKMKVAPWPVNEEDCIQKPTPRYAWPETQVTTSTKPSGEVPLKLYFNVRCDSHEETCPDCAGEEPALWIPKESAISTEYTQKQKKSSKGVHGRVSSFQHRSPSACPVSTKDIPDNLSKPSMSTENEDTVHSKGFARRKPASFFTRIAAVLSSACSHTKAIQKRIKKSFYRCVPCVNVSAESQTEEQLDFYCKQKKIPQKQHSEITKGPTETIPFTHVADEQSEITKGHTETIPFTHVADKQSEITKGHTETIPFTHVADEQSEITEGPTETISFTHVADEQSEITEGPTEIIPFTHVADEQSEITEGPTETIPFTHVADEQSEITEGPTETIPFTHVAGEQSEITEGPTETIPFTHVAEEAVTTLSVEKQTSTYVTEVTQTVQEMKEEEKPKEQVFVTKHHSLQYTMINMALNFLRQL
ncbi:uncharacterized protein LOC122816141 [Protopterus annectens]|uniref:uncharacterized protein LOC122816141 n=1 Tax=Protopterus annectens TaxID=7888 RepID=UPI001CFB8FBE|nr:uncharacterized protein LOC122816141 [Protopterus annectens]